MSRKTNPLLLRFGISSLWQNNLDTTSIYSLIIKFQPLINYFLLFNKLTIIKICVTMNVIYLYTFKQKSVYRILKKAINSYSAKANRLDIISRVFGIKEAQLK
jgi:hypothetical protein